MKCSQIYLYFIHMAFIILLICFIFLALLLLLCGDVEINPGPTSSTMLQIDKRIDSLIAPSCVKERTPLTLVPIHDVIFIMIFTRCPHFQT